MACMMTIAQSNVCGYVYLLYIVIVGPQAIEILRESDSKETSMYARHSTHALLYRTCTISCIVHVQ